MVSEDRPRIILDDAVLREDFVPPDLCARRPQLELIEACLEPARKGRKPTHLWLHGCSGSGKTATAKKALAQLERQAGIRSVVVNCWERDSLYEILDQIITDLRIFRAEEHRSSVKLARLEKCLADKGLIVLLDEVDKIPPGERSRALYSLNNVGNVGLICISNTLGALFDLEERVRSRINPRTVAFRPYSAEDTGEILTRRAHLAMVSGACPAYLIKRIAGVCSGDARVAIQTLRNAAESAEREGRDTVNPSDLVAGWHNTPRIKTDHVLAKLTEDHRAIFDILSKRKELLSTKLREAYLRHCSRHNRKPIAVRTFSAYVNQLARLGLIACERARVKGNVRLLKSLG